MKEHALTEEEKEKFIRREKYYRFTLETDKRHEKLFSPYGISFSVYRVLTFLMMYPEGIAPSRIADDLMILRQNMTNILDSLEKKSLIERIADASDRRRLIVKLLPKGEELARQVIQEETRYGEQIGKHISKEDREQYHLLEQKMYEAKVAALNDILSEREGKDGQP